MEHFLDDDEGLSAREMIELAPRYDVATYAPMRARVALTPP
jgi:hypothetical protein